MAAKVVDASAIAAVLFDELEAEGVASSIEGHQLIAPGLLDFELANICWKKVRRHPEEAHGILAGLRRRRLFRIRLAAVEYEAVVALAVETRLSAYDASYLWLARELGIELVTLDGRLAAAAG